MAKHIAILAGIVPAFLLAGCGEPNAYRGLESPHQPVVTRNNYALDLQTSGYGLAPGEADRLAGWMSLLNLGYGDRVYVADAQGYDAAAREAVAGEAARFGLLLSDAAPVTPGSVAPGTVRVVVTRMSASVPGCPDYADVDQPNFDAHTTSNFGCAINSNLAAMVARPEDLVRGQPGSGTTDPDTAVKAIQTFRKATPTGAEGLDEVSTTKESN
ncbi:CpaD family pilus assembly protein [Stakelama sp. CBK3Z-3]|uniref:CpaD family pilus assembly protein n=1 Tax=Stakelama flava TaxID=2860338 RepID=A0ABS6XP08_9SPHN|nr:CpaD family pilus assembly protein [Stakelama flava]MBW4331498.1 CpaD family pilus assembly protein [Stakelama flava]